MTRNVPGGFLDVLFSFEWYTPWAVKILGMSREVNALSCSGQLEIVYLCPSLQIRASNFFTSEADESWKYWIKQKKNKIIATKIILIKYHCSSRTFCDDTVCMRLSAHLGLMKGFVIACWTVGVIGWNEKGAVTLHSMLHWMSYW